MEEVVEITVLPDEVFVMMEEDTLYRGGRGSWAILWEDSQLVKINVKVNLEVTGRGQFRWSGLRRKALCLKR